MEKVALFFEGKPNLGEDKSKYSKSLDRDFNIMENIFSKEGYRVIRESFDNFLGKIDCYSNLGDLAIYYSGHGRDSKFEGYKVQDVLNNLSKGENKKTVILDSCLEGEGYGDFNLPKNSKFISAKKVGQDSSIAKLLWDHIFARKGSLDNLSKKTFEDMKQNWVYFKEQ
jgi:hypothetical protein